MWELTGYIKQSDALLCLIHTTLPVTFHMAAWNSNGDVDEYIMTKCLFVILLQVIRATMIREDDGDNGDDDDADNDETERTEQKNV